MAGKVVLVGAGPVGALAALYAARRGYEVELYEFRGDLRDPTTVPLNFTKSINLAISERGLNSIKQSGSTKLLDGVLAETIPMHGRMIHGKKAGELYEASQAYDAFGRSIRAIDRAGLNKRLLDELDDLPNVKLFFNHKLVGADFKARKAWFDQQAEIKGDHAQNPTTKDKDTAKQQIEVNFDLLLGADGAHSATRYHMMKYARTSYSQEYIDTLWCEFHMDSIDGEHRLSPHHLHIWPAGDSMFIAIPSLGGTFTCTLFASAEQFAALEAAEPAQIIDFFNTTFPGVAGSLISEENVRRQFHDNPHLPLISIKTTPYHYSSSVVILGDAAHAMVPFYGQGMNAGLEDVRVLFERLDAAPKTAAGRATALEEYSRLRTPDAHAINDLALRNYQEMRSDVVSPLYRLRKTVEEALAKYVPSLGFATQYSRVSFSNMRYSHVEKLAARQGLVLSLAGVASVLAPVLTYGIWAWIRWRNATRPGRGLAKGMFSLGLLGEKIDALFA